MEPVNGPKRLPHPGVSRSVELDHELEVLVRESKVLAFMVPHAPVVKDRLNYMKHANQVHCHDYGEENLVELDEGVAQASDAHEDESEA